ncbi:MAG: hypothetical protein HY912_20740 [Desulfomonile tiedjei]|uniref:PilY1 beta-propeller domain-containing protein n=1 Tax=Desulfomonile tiedjei TaxID=2358 RepID=A0A9D6V5J5_9BACT|nr:hypothetical protein [Desulfomonile tiedjei]
MIAKRLQYACALGVLVLFSSMGLWLGNEAAAATYSPCTVPAVVGSASRPNVFIVMDYSGSMQFPAYFDTEDVWSGYLTNKIADCYSTSVYKTYDPAYSYYGTFESDKYYVYVPTTGSTTLDYFKLAPTQPVTTYSVTNSVDGGTSKITFTASGHSFATGDLVSFCDLTSHAGLNGNAFTVTAVSGSTFTVTSTTLNSVSWNGTADTAGSVVKRITGTFLLDSSGNQTGISGNVLNYALTSRIDAALKALIGGRSICPDGDSYCYLRPQGARRRVQDASHLYADFYARPATIESSTTYPNDYNTSGGYYKDSSSYHRDIFVTIKGKYTGQLSSTSPQNLSRYFEAWTFTLTQKTRVQITLDGEWPNKDYLLVYSSAPSNNWGGSSYIAASNSGSTASIDTDLAAGTYYVVATPYDQKTTTSYQKAYTLWSNVSLTPYAISGYTHNGQTLTKIGAFPSGRARLRLEPDADGNKDSRAGVIQKSFAYVRFGFEYYNSSYVGKIAVGCDNTDRTLLINAFEGVTNSSAKIDFSNIYPYNGTPTGEALQEASDYFSQTNSYGNADNSSFVGTSIKTTAADPYYTKNTLGNAVAVSCRKSYVVLVSDGDYNGSVDPAKPAQLMHNPASTTFRSDISDLHVDTYSIMAFSQSTTGYNSMKAVAMYGGFKHITGCGSSKSYPYPQTALPSNSLNFTWPVSNCNPSNSDCSSSCSSSCYCITCCKEWNSTWDRDGDGTNESKGLPDNYYQADDGKKLEEALTKVMSAVTTGTATASAVATVSQETSSDDVIIRGVFQAADPDNPTDFLWKGHLEAYFPFTSDESTLYDFELSSFLNTSDPDLAGLCMGLTSSSRHCWDSGEILKAQTPVSPSERLIYTWLYDSSVSKYVQKTLDSANVSLSDLGVTTTTERDNIISWVRGNTVSSYRNRNGWILGDIVYSTPVVVGPPRLGKVSKRDPDVKSYQVFLGDQAKRSKVVYVGANDGMLHAFLMGTTTDGSTWAQNPSEDSSIGKELWAYIPSNLLTELQALKDTAYGSSTGTSPCVHRAMVDLAPRYWELYIKSDYCGSSADSQGRCWRSVIVGGERGGGDVYFAIDVTNPVPVSSDSNSGPKVLWEYSVLKNRVVAEEGTASTDSCMQVCRNACTTSCKSTYSTCYSACSTTTCKATCLTDQATCQADCEANCASKCASATYKAYVPFKDAYESIKALPMAWSQPYLGRIHVPTSVKFYVGEPDSDTHLPTTTVKWDTNNNNRSVVFIGGGIHIYDRTFDTTPTVDDRFKMALFWPNLLMLDIETGYNLFEYIWPIILNHNVKTFTNRQMGSNTIPFAMSDVLALDVWDQTNHVLSDDGFIDRVYVGDLNGYFYGIKFNLSETFPDASSSNTSFGVEVDIWPTKPISSSDLITDYYRSNLQPITVSPVASLEEASSTASSTAYAALRLIFGTGKYDDVVYGDDDKTDTAKMSLYNLRDPIATVTNGVTHGLPIIGSSATDAWSSVGNTNFKIQIVTKCGLPSSITSFSSNCNWATSEKVTDGTSAMLGLYKGDCCESSNTTCTGTPCYDCIYDFRNPCESGSDGCGSPIDSADAPAAGKPGERVLGKPLVTAGLVFVTTFVPPFDICGYTGQGYLYVFNYMCQPFSSDYNPFPSEETTTLTTTSGGTTNTVGYQVSLGSGVPSRPVIDSKGNSIIVQMSDGTIKKLTPDLGANKPVQFRGWRVR